MHAARILARMGSVFAGALAVVVFMVLASMGDAGLVGPGVLGVLVVFLGGQALAHRLPRRAVVDVWPPVPAFAPAGAHPPPPARRVAVALAGPEARELALSPAFGAGVALCATVVVLFGFVWPEDSEGDLAGVAQLLPIFVHPFVGMVLLAAHRARTRSRRDGTEELFEACPATPDTRNLGHLATAWLPVVVCAAFSGLMVALVAMNVAQAWGPFGSSQVLAMASAAVLGVGAVALGVALARWAPWTVAPIVALVVIGAVTIELATAGGANQREPLRMLSTFLGDAEVDYRLFAPHHVARLGWLLSLTVLVVAIGLLKDRRGPSVVALAGASAAAATGFALAAARPIDLGDAERIAAMLNDPTAHQECVEAGGLDVCAWDGDGDLARLLAGEIGPVLAAAPAGAADGYAIDPAAQVDVRYLDPEVRERLVPVRRPGVLGAPVGGHPEGLQGARMWAALAAVGVAEDLREGSSTVIADQARGVVALWLAVQGADPSTVRAMTTFVAANDHGIDEWRPWPDPCYAGPAPVRWAVADVGAVRLLLELPPGDVEEELADRWAWVADPSTTTADLLDVFGLEPVVAGRQLTRAGAC